MAEYLSGLETFAVDFSSPSAVVVLVLDLVISLILTQNRWPGPASRPPSIFASYSSKDYAFAVCSAYLPS